MSDINNNFLILKRINDKLRVIGKLSPTNDALGFEVIKNGLEDEARLLKKEILKFKEKNKEIISGSKEIDTVIKYLESIDYIIEPEPDSNQIQIQGILEGGSDFSQKISGSRSAYHQDIERSIQESISRVPRMMAEKAYADFLEKYQAKNYNDAVGVLYKNPPDFFLRYSGSEKEVIIHHLYTMIKGNLIDEAVIAFKCLIGFDDGLYSLDPEFIEKFITVYQSDLSKEEVSVFDVYLAYSFNKRNLKTKAYVKFKYIVDTSSLSKIIARGYLGLFRVSDISDPDSIEFLSKAADFFRQSGELPLASQCHAGIAKVKSKTSLNEALHHLDVSVKLIGDKQKSPSITNLEILTDAAAQRISLSQYKEALDQLLPVIDQYMGVYGAEYSLAIAINTAITAANSIGRADQADELSNKLTLVERNLKNDDYFLRKRIAKCLESNDDEALKAIEKECESKPKELCLIKVIIGSRENQSFDKALEYLDEAKNIAEKNHIVDLLEISSIALANLFKENDDKKALKIYKSVLSNNPFNFTARQNTLALLFKAELWVDAINLLEEQIKLLGELPNMLLLYGEALSKIKDKKAYGILIKAKHATDDKVVHNKIEHLIASLPTDLINDEFISNDMVNPISLECFEGALEELSNFIANDKRMSFWTLDKKSQKHKWRARPESLAQDLTHTFLKSKFGNQIKVFEEVGAGAGRIDLFLQLSSKLEVVLELKMCGSTYSSTYVKDGVPQIVHYMKNKETHIGYLVVFDSRSRDQGKDFQDIIIYETYSVSPIVIDVRSEAK